MDRISAEWEKWESEVAGRVGGDKVKASGRFSLFKGDVKTDTLLIDCKWTSHGSYKLEIGMWAKLSEWARNEGRIPVLAVRCEETGLEVVVMTETDYCSVFKSDDTSGMSVDSSTSSKSVSKKLLGDNGVAVFVLGRRRLVACCFDTFESAVVLGGGSL